jgi:hypothetical protein
LTLARGVIDHRMAERCSAGGSNAMGLKVFLSYRFHDHNRALAVKVTNLLESHGVHVVTGEDLGGADVSETVKTYIKEVDALVGLVTKDPPGLKKGSRWVGDEVVIARALGKPAITLVEPGLPKRWGAFTDNERIAYQAEDPLPAFLKLSRTIRLWKDQLGTLVKVRLEPVAVARQLGMGACEARLVQNGTAGPWEPVTLHPEQGSVYVYVPGVQDESLVQVRATHKNQQWVSEEEPQWMTIKLKRP